MKFVDEFRAADKAQDYADAIAAKTTRDWSIIIDTAIAIVAMPGVIFCSFGDMARVPSTHGSLLEAKAAGGDLRLVYSPIEALQIARENPQKEVVFFAVGFETTAPATAMAAYRAKQEGLKNFSMLVSHVLVPPAIEALMRTPACRVDGFLAAGHVCTIMGWHEYQPLADQYGVPIIVTGFEPVDILQGIYMCVSQLEEGRTALENQYSRVVRPQGNVAAQEMVWRVFEVAAQEWRGIGVIPKSGLQLREAFEDFDAERRFTISHRPTSDNGACISGEILQGLKKPMDCPAFGKRCTPMSPLGATMVSSEGACAAYYQFRRDDDVDERQN